MQALSLDPHVGGTDPGIRPSLRRWSHTLQHLQHCLRQWSAANWDIVQKNGLMTVPLMTYHPDATRITEPDDERHGEGDAGGEQK